MQIKESQFKIIVTANKKKNQIKGYDKEKKAYLVDIKEKAEDNKANIEIIKFFSKELGKKVRIQSGLRSREKILKLFD